MRNRLLSLILIFAALSLVATACAPQQEAPAPTASNQLATVAPSATVAPTETAAPTATTAPTETPAPTATTQPTNTASPVSPTFTPQPETAGYTYSDDFSDVYSGWPIGVNDNSAFGYEEGAYFIEIKSESFVEPVVAKDYLGTGDAVFEVDAWKGAGSDAGDFGVVCDFQDFDNYITMGIRTDGSISLYQMKDGEESTLLYQERRFTPADKYHLIANCQKGHFTLDVNGKVAIDLEDPILTSDGRVGIYGGSFEEGPFMYYFDNFKAEQTGKVTTDPFSDLPTAPLAELGAVVFSDDFSTTAGDWYVFDGDDSGSAYEDGYYTISIKTPMYAQWNLPNAFEGTGDAVIEVDARLVSGSTLGDFGIMCGYIDNDNFHVLGIASDGYAELIRWVDGDDDIFASEQNAFELAEEYHLVASCVDGNLSLSVNGVEIISASSEFLGNDGSVGLYGGTFDEGNTVYGFDNFIVHEP